MDNLTHSLAGALIGQAGLKRKTGLAMPALIIGANLPDVDAACFFWLDGVEHLGFRRGITHGPIAWLLLPLILAGALFWFDRWQARRGRRPNARLPVHFGWLYALSFLACLTHPALDWLNVYGIRFLEPFSSRWFYGDTLFIIDVWLWLGMGLATWLSLRREKKGGNWRKPALVGLLVAVGYIGANLMVSRQYARIVTLEGSGTTIAAPVPLTPWKRDLIFTNASGRHLVLPGYSNFDPDPLHSVRAGDAYLAACRLTDLADRDPQLAAFLFWSRAPFVERRADGSLRVRDARFLDPLASDRFSVKIPRRTCKQFFQD